MRAVLVLAGGFLNSSLGYLLFSVYVSSGMGAVQLNSYGRVMTFGWKRLAGRIT